MKLDEILSKAGRHKTRKRVGRGDGSGSGKTSGRGHKGYGSRAGAKRRLGYEGGQNPLLQRIPQRGFNNKNFRKEYQVVNVDQLEESFDAGSTVDLDALIKARLVRPDEGPVKVLGDGELSKKLTIQADRFSRSALAKIAEAGGTAQTPDGEAVEALAEKAPKASDQKPEAGDEQGEEGKE